MDGSSFFKPAGAAPSKRLVASVWGPPKAGKTHLALTFPAPIYLLNLDLGLDPLLSKFDGKTIHDARFVVDDPEDYGSVARTLTNFIHAYEWALKEADDAAGTVVVDTASLLWDMVQVVKLAQVKQKKFKAEVAKKGGDENRVDYDLIKLHQFEYAEANTYMATLLRKALYRPSVNVVFIGSAKNAYDGSGNRLNTLEFQGFGKMPSIAEATITMRRAPDNSFVGRIDDCRFEPGYNGTEIPGLTYDTLKSLLLEG